MDEVSFLFTSESVNEATRTRCESALCGARHHRLQLAAASVPRRAAQSATKCRTRCSMRASRTTRPRAWPAVRGTRDARARALLLTRARLFSSVNAETCTKTGMIMIFGEITTSATVNYEAVIREALKEIGYDDPAKGCSTTRRRNVIVAIEEQSPDIAQSVDATKLEDIGAGDQGIMFGYASDETESLMPLTHQLATSLGARLTEVRKTRGCSTGCGPTARRR